MCEEGGRKKQFASSSLPCVSTASYARLGAFLREGTARLAFPTTGDVRVWTSQYQIQAAA